MLMIREMQMKAFEQAAVRNFENRLLEYLQEYFYKHCKILGTEQMREVIRLGIAQAEKYNFISERDVHLYVCLMLMLGSYFDCDPQLPWAANTLTQSWPN